MKKNKLIFKILGITLLIAGLAFIIMGLVDFIKVGIYNENLAPTEMRKSANMLWPLLATPCMFGGFFLFILGFGKKKEYGTTR